MKLEDIELEWQKDAEIGSDLAKEALKIPQLHGKWYGILLNEKRQLLALKTKLERLQFDLDGYYAKTLTQSELDELGWVLSDKKYLRQDIPKAIASDQRYIDMNCRISMQSDKVEFVKDIIKTIHGRSFIIRDAIEYAKFTVGVM